MALTLNLPKKLSFPLAVAVSGGGDSVALLRLLSAEYGAENLTALHFDHQLRTDSKQDTEFVEHLAQELGCTCVIGTPQSKPAGNLEQWARQERYQFFKAVMAEHGIAALCAGHTLDDVAETFLQRAGKGSGVVGLAVLPADTSVNDIRILRPLVDISRADLRTYLNEIGQNWCEDSQNTDSQFQRVRIRQLKAKLEAAGISWQGLHASSQAMQRARTALENIVAQKIEQYAQVEDEEIRIDLAFMTEPQEIKLELVRWALQILMPGEQVPRTSKRQRLLGQIAQGKLPHELGGVRFEIGKNQLLARRVVLDKLAQAS